MPLPVWIAATYLVTNFALTVWIVRAETGGRQVSDSISTVSGVLRYGPPLLGLGYLVTKAGDWPFVLFVAAFFALAAWLLHGLLNYPTRPPRP
jgi:hypothetical protein